MVAVPDNQLEADKEAKVDPADTLNYSTLARHANLIVELAHERDQRVRRQIDAWKEARGCAQPSPEQVDVSGADTAGQEYDALVEMGPGIISHVMLAYDNDRTGPWFKLMHRLVRGKAMDAGATDGNREDVVVQQQYDLWRDWFENKNHDEAGRVPRNYGDSGTYLHC